MLNSSFLIHNSPSYRPIPRPLPYVAPLHKEGEFLSIFLRKIPLSESCAEGADRRTAVEQFVPVISQKQAPGASVRSCHWQVAGGEFLDISSVPPPVGVCSFKYSSKIWAYTIEPGAEHPPGYRRRATVPR